MASPSPPQTPFDILEVFQGPPTRPVHYRIKVESTVKYLTAPNPLSTLPDMHGDCLGFDTVPAGDWDVAILVPNVDGKLAIALTEKKRFPDATPTWHPSKIDLLELRGLKKPDEGYDDDDHDGDDHDDDSHDDEDDDDLQLLGHFPSAVFPSPESLGAAKVAAFWNLDLEGRHNHGLSRESHIYSLIQNTSIAPKFLAHLTDNHKRVIGYVLESVPAREADIGDLDLCRDVLQKLHTLGIVHGRLNRGLLDKEMSSLEEILQQRPQKPVHDKRHTKEITAIQERDGYIHPVLFWQLKHEGQISISQDDHRAMLADLEEKNWRWSEKDVKDAVERLRKNGGHWN